MYFLASSPKDNRSRSAKKAARLGCDLTHLRRLLSFRRYANEHSVIDKVQAAFFKTRSPLVVLTIIAEVPP